jgi:hypothetical protein
MHGVSRFQGKMKDVLERCEHEKEGYKKLPWNGRCSQTYWLSFAE